ncbi:DNA polymerase epsilon subunit C [Lecanosticta acicola]|uniref:DNA polymerase epsilon subunit C, partial n=1 Tax=Lecanosticta acicola TaxID=111012 RepID=A0AAI9EF38_9PEZI|nr:DNA polymerase epsilon subunit C [Lecanosticta acicola]
MDGFRPQSPDLSSYQPQSPDLSGLRPESPDLSGIGSPRFGNFSQHRSHFPAGAFGGHHHYTGYQPTSVPQQYNYQPYQQSAAMPPRAKPEADDDEYMPDVTSSKRPRRVKQEPSNAMNGLAPAFADVPPVKAEDSDPTLGCKLNTAFPVARIKRIMQADEDIGKVAQVTPTVVSRALELFMIKLISAAATQAKGSGPAASKGPRRVLAQHLKKAIVTDEKFDFLNEIVDKVPDAPSKGKKETNSDSDEPKPKKRGKKRKDSGDEF